MSAADRTKWDEKYRAGGHLFGDPDPFLLAVADALPTRGRALDVAGGSGRHAVWLAQRGLEVTLADVSRVGLSIAQERAAAEGLSVATRCLDLESAALADELPGPWDLIVEFYYLQRDLFPVFPQLLSPGGLLVFAQPTRTNLDRNPRPGPDYVLEDGELAGLVEGLEVLRLEEGWSAAGRHEARLLARKPD